MTILYRLREEVTNLNQKLEGRIDELTDLLVDKNHSRDCKSWEGIEEDSSRWGLCGSKGFEQRLGEPRGVCDGDEAPCTTFFEARE